MMYALARTPRKAHALLTGTQEALVGTSFSLISGIGGLAIVWVGFSGVFFAAALALVLSGVLLLWYDRRARAQLR
jgi:hypothetical protein